jgi:methylenetetrahydrofolate reductase (NADPH)
LGRGRAPHRRAARRSARAGRSPFAPHPDGYANAAELVAGLKRSRRSRSRSPPIPNAPGQRPPRADLDNLKRKIDAGADRAITQFFFSPDNFFRFRDAAAAAGIDAEIVPGILPVSNVAQTRKFAGHVRRGIPRWMDGCSKGSTTFPPRAS